MPTIKYWEETGQRWVPASPEHHDERNIPVTGGTVTGPFPVSIDATTDPYHLVSYGPITAVTYTTTRLGSLNTAIVLRPGRSVDLGGAEVTRISDGGEPDAITVEGVDAVLGGTTVEQIGITAHFWTVPDGTDQPPPVPVVVMDREGLVTVQGIVRSAAVISAANPVTRIMGIVSEPYWPKEVARFASFCSGTSNHYCRVDVNPDGTITYAEGPDIPPLTDVILDGSSYPTR